MNKKFALSSLRMQNSEFIGLMLKLLVFAEGITSEEALSSVLPFKTDVGILNRHLAENCNETASQTAQRLHEERLDAYMALRYNVKSLLRSPSVNHASAGTKYWNIIEKVEDPRRANQDAATRALGVLLSSFHEIDSNERVEMGIESCVKTLADRQNDFIAAAQMRGQEADYRIEHTTLKLRKNCLESFYALAFHAAARARNHADVGCANFVEQANGEIDMRKRLLKTRRTLAQKAAEEGKVVEEGKVAEGNNANKDLAIADVGNVAVEANAPENGHIVEMATGPEEVRVPERMTDAAV